MKKELDQQSNISSIGTEKIDDSLSNYEIEIETGKRSYAGTDANIYIKLYGENNKHTDLVKIDRKNTNDFEKGSIVIEKIRSKNIGKIQKIHIEHDNSGIQAGWFLERIKVKSSNAISNFEIKEWLSNQNKKIHPSTIATENTLKFKYTVIIQTGENESDGTNAGVSIQLYGEDDKTTTLQGLDTVAYNDFQKDGLGAYIIYSDEELGNINKIKVQHDNTGDSPWWYIKRILVDNIFTFTIEDWLGTDEPDIHPCKTYTIDISKSYDLRKFNLRKPKGKEIEHWYSLDFDKTRQVKISTSDVSKEIRLYSNGIPYSLWAKGGGYVGCGIDAANSFMGWFNENITRNDIKKYVTTHKAGKNIFATPAEVGNGLAKLMKNKSSIDSFETIRYSFNAKNYKADKVNYSSKEEVHIAIIKTIQAHLEAGTPLIALINNGNHWVTIVGIVVEYTSSSKRYISVDDTTITYIDMTAGTTRNNANYRNMKIFPWPYDAGRDIAHAFCSSYVDGMLITLKNYLSLKYSEKITPPYVVSIYTGDATNAGTDSNIFVKLFGEYGESDEVKISSICEDYERNSSNHIERTVGIIKTDKYLGKIDRIKVRSDGSGDNSDWLLKDIIVKKEKDDLNEIYRFKGGTWFEKNRRLTKIITENSYKSKFKISLKTGDLKDAGTNSTIFIKIFGESKTSYSISSELQNIDNLDQDDNETNTTSSYYIYAPKEMLDIEKVYIESDNTGNKPEWFLEKITVEKIDQKTDKTLATYQFTVKEWLKKDNPNVTVYEDLIKENYRIKIKTGDISSAGTNSNVYIKLYGDRITDFIKLNNLSHNDFERGKTDLFNISNINIGKIEKIEIKHDNTGDNPSWFLEKVEVVKQNKQYNFTAQRWLSRGPGLSLNAIINEDLDQFKYLVTIKTANTKGSGTNANIYIKLYGEHEIETFLQRMDNPAVDDFEQNRTGIYIIYSNKKLGEINKIYIESDNSGDSADWEIQRTSIVLESEPKIKYLFDESHRFNNKSKSKFFIRSK